jgi:hypothetical protein
MQTRAWSSILPAVVLLVFGCDSQGQAANGSVESPATGSVPPQMRSAGWLTHFDGAVEPNCHASLLGGSHVLTAAGCLEGTYINALSFSVANDPQRPIPIARELGPTTTGWTLIELEVPFDQGLGAEVDSESIAPGDSLELLSFTYVVQGEEIPPAMQWTAEVTNVGNETFEAELRDGAPGCHGDLGVAAFHNGTIAGVLVASRSGGPQHPSDPICRSTFIFSKIAASLLQAD